jgi:hypothetical protein
MTVGKHTTATLRLAVVGIFSGLVQGPMAFAQDSAMPSLGDVAVTTLGARGDLSVATGGLGDLDLLLTERLRWRVLPSLPGTTRVWADGRLVVDTNGEVLLERSRLSRLAVSSVLNDLELDLGRSVVRYGGPRLVDGLQGLWKFNKAFSLGAWSGFAPDLFTTLPSSRLGGGVFASFNALGFRGSALMERQYSKGSVDRTGALLQLRFESLPTISLSSRLDVQQDQDSKWRVADAGAFASISPNEAWKFYGDYHAYSSYRYLETQDLDPAIQRFAKRAEAVGLITGIPQESPDQTLYHQAGTRIRWKKELESGPQVMASMLLRARTSSMEGTDYVLLAPNLGIQDWASGRLGSFIDASFRKTEEGLAGDLGTTVSVQSTGDLDWVLDSSLRALFSPEYDGVPGAYLDSFLDWGFKKNWVVSAGGYAALEHDTIVDELSLGGFLFVSYRVRPEKARASIASDLVQP